MSAWLQAGRRWLAVSLLLSAACRPASATLHVPWAGQPRATEPASRADVQTLNGTYARTRSRVLVREIERPTRAALDYAAYHANFMIAESPPEQAPAAASSARIEHPFAGLLETGTLTADITATPLSQRERAQALAFAPLSEYLLARKLRGAEALAALGSAVRAESWGLPATPGLAPQSPSEIFLHARPDALPELWLKIEFAAWFEALGALPDQDRDGYPEVYARARADILTAELVQAIERDYTSRVLEPAEVKAWANQLSSYWYPSFNTDLVPPESTWPGAETEAPIKRELAGFAVRAPAVVLRGKPAGQASYNVFVIKSLTAAAAPGPGPASAALVLAKTEPTPMPGELAERVQRELAAAGGSWEAWNAKLAPFQGAIRKRLEQTPANVKAIAGLDGFLFYRSGLEFVVGGDLERQPAGKNPLPIIVAWQKQLAARGVDFLFVPVPDKLEIFPDLFDARFRPLAGQVVNPALRRFMARLAEQGVESVDLHTPLLAARSQDDSAGEEPLYQHQDTHWSARGLELVAELLAARIERYPWYLELAQRARSYQLRNASFSRFGDLHSRLPEIQKRGYQPESLVARQVIGADGTPYEDQPDSPIVLLGDSFTGVYQLTDSEHAGLSAHIARHASYPLDLVMSYGGGPNVRTKLLRRGEAALAQKKLVIWLMADRDLYNYWEDWQASPATPAGSSADRAGPTQSSSVR